MKVRAWYLCVRFCQKATFGTYESEFRLVAHERSNAPMTNKNMLLTDKSFLQLPSGALSSIIVGLKGNYAELQRIVGETTQP